jgi:ribosomal protein S18 acetylase RimI-like enzyme
MSGENRRNLLPDFGSIYRVDPENWAEVSKVLGESFSQDEDMRRLKRFPRENFPRFFEFVCEFLIKGGKSKSWIFREGQVPLGAVVCIPSDWNAPLRTLFSFLRSVWREIGFNFFPFIHYLNRFESLSRPKSTLLRVIFLGVIPAARGKGVGRALLRKVFEEAQYSKIQLEVERENRKALNLYIAEGFRIEKEFVVGKVPFLVMVKELSQKDKPYQQENRYKKWEGIPHNVAEE